MKSITCMKDLDEYGIHPLTGEADNLGFRILCDVNSKGYRIICETFGLVADAAPLSEKKTPLGWASNWNPGPTNNPHVASIMLAPHDIVSIGIIALITEGRCHTVLLTDKWSIFGLHEPELWFPGEYDYDKGEYTASPGYKSTPEASAYWPTSVYGKVERIIKGHDHQHRGTRNVHAFSGRAI